MAKHFLYLTNSRLVSLAARGTRLVARREFEATPAGAAEFERHLKSLKNLPTHIITDLAEEDFRLDTIPHVSSGDRGAIFARRLTQIFRNTPYRHATLQGREVDGRRDDRVLYTAITNPDVLRPWVECLDRLRAPLAGIHSSAMLSGRLLKDLGLAFPHTLLVTFTPGESVRQTYFRDREIKFSRLTPIDLEEGQSLGAMLAEETTRTWQYLESLRHFGPEDRLEVCVLVHPKDRAAIEPALRDLAQIQYRVLDIEQVAAKVGLKPPPLGSSAEEVMVHLFLRRPMEDHFASAELRRHDTLRTARLALTGASATVLAAGIAWGAWNVTRVFAGNEEDVRVGQQVQALNREYEEITRSLPELGVGGAAMRDSVAFYNGSLRGFPTLTAFLVPVSHVLDRYPQVRLTQLAWQASDDPKASPVFPASQPRLAPPVKSVAKIVEAAPPAPPEEASPTFAGGRYEVALVEATVPLPGTDFRRVLGEVERLAADLRGIPGYSADVVESPLDTNPGRVIQGRLDARTTANSEARFLLRIVRDRGGSA